MNINENAASNRPRIALAIGCPGGIAPELTARMLVDPTVTSKALLVTIGDRRVIEYAARIAGVDLALEFLRPGDDLPDGSARPIFVDRADLDPTTIPVGVISEAGGRSALGNFKSAIEMATRGKVDAVAFSPFNKSAMRLAHPSYQDEGVFLAEMLGIDGTASEFNIIPRACDLACPNFGRRRFDHVRQRASGIAVDRSDDARERLRAAANCCRGP